MTKRYQAMKLALALHIFGKQMVKEKKTDEGYTEWTFWFTSGRKTFTVPEDVLRLSNRIARDAKR